MVRKKKKKRLLSKSARGVGTLVVGATGASVIGSAMPAGTGGALSSAGTGMASMVGPATTAFGAGIVMRQMRNLNPESFKNLKCSGRLVRKRIKKKMKGGER